VSWFDVAAGLMGGARDTTMAKVIATIETDESSVL
jgi:hypothetical protein